MKHFTRNLYFAILFVTAVFSTNGFADVKVKSRQTAGGQTFENTTYIKGKRQRAEQNYGGMQMINLTQCDLKRGVQLNPNAKTYIVNLFNQTIETANQNASADSKDDIVRAGGTVTSTVTYKDTGERKKLFGYDAKRVITTMETISSPDSCSPLNSKMEIDGWYIAAAFALDCDYGINPGGYGSNRKGGCQDRYRMKTVGNANRGYPVYEKMTMFDAGGKEMMSTVNEVVELSQATLDQALFEIPPDYREVKDMSEMYAASTSDNYNGTSTAAPSAINAVIKQQAQTNANANSTPGAKQAGVVRIGLADVKVGAVGDGIASNDLAAAIQNSLGEFFQGTKIELVPLNAKLSSAIESEAKQKECDYILYANVSHKKGGGGFGGMLGSAIAQGVGRAGIGHTGSTIGNAVGQAAAAAIVTAGTLSANVKSKDEITLDVKMNAPGNSAAVLTKQFKAKAKSNGEDIITPVVEQTAQAIFSAAGK